MLGAPELVDDAQLDVLLALKRGDVTIEALVDADRAGRLKGAAVLSDLKLRVNLWAAIEETLPAMGQSPDTRRRYRTSLRMLAGLPQTKLAKNARVRDLALTPWTTLRSDRRVAGKSPADWNHVRRAVSRFLTVLLCDVHHPFRRDVMTHMPSAKEGRGRTPELPVDGFWAIIGEVPPHAA